MIFTKKRLQQLAGLLAEAGEPPMVTPGTAQPNKEPKIQEEEYLSQISNIMNSKPGPAQNQRHIARFGQGFEWKIENPQKETLNIYYYPKPQMTRMLHLDSKGKQLDAGVLTGYPEDPSPTIRQLESKLNYFLGK
jgi:hypothetical protein